LSYLICQEQLNEYDIFYVIGVAAEGDKEMILQNVRSAKFEPIPCETLRVPLIKLERPQKERNQYDIGIKSERTLRHTSSCLDGITFFFVKDQSAM